MTDGFDADRALDRAEQATGYRRRSTADLIEALIAEIIDYRRQDVSLKQELRVYIQELVRQDESRISPVHRLIALDLQKLVDKEPRLKATQWPLRREDSVSFRIPDRHGHERRVSLVWHEDGDSVRLIADGGIPLDAVQIRNNEIIVTLRE